jgi:protein gp37
MADNSAIEWTEATWNPVTGCDKVSPGCAHCYAETFAERWRGIPGHPYEQGFALKLWPQRLEQPLKWSRPRMIFVNSMSDLLNVSPPGWPQSQRRRLVGVSSGCSPSNRSKAVTMRPMVPGLARGKRPRSTSKRP